MPPPALAPGLSSKKGLFSAGQAFLSLVLLSSTDFLRLQQEAAEMSTLPLSCLRSLGAAFSVWLHVPVLPHLRPSPVPLRGSS